MRTKLIALLLVSSLMWTHAKGAEDEVQIRKCFERYRNAVLKSDGDAAADTVNAATLAYYENMRDLALRGDKAAVQKQNLSNRLMILSMRSRMDSKDLRAMDGRKIVAHAVKKDWISTDSVARASLGPVKVEGNAASAEFIVDETASGYFVMFSKEGADWKFDLTSLFEPGELVMKEAVEKLGSDENAVLFQLLEAASGKKVSEEIWKPVDAR